MIEFNKVRIGSVVTVYMKDERFEPGQWIETTVLGRQLKEAGEVEVLGRTIKRSESRVLIVDLSGVNFRLADNNFTLLEINERCMIQLGGHNDSSLVARNPEGSWSNWSVSITLEQGEIR